MTQPKITVHWLNNSRSQRILWLLEELKFEYNIKEYQRDPKTRLAPKELGEIHPLAKSPVIEIEEVGEKTVILAESGAIVSYLIEKYGQILEVAVDSKARAEYLYWLHFAEGTAMLPLIFSIVFAQMPKQAPFIVRPLVYVVAQSVMALYVKPKLVQNFAFIESYLEGKEFFVDGKLTGADIMMSFVIEALESAFGYEKYPNSLRFITAMKQRDAWQKAEKKGDATDLGQFVR